MGTQLTWLCFLCVTKCFLCVEYILAPAKVLPDKKTWIEGIHTSDCHLLGRTFLTDKIEDVRVQGVTDDNSELSTQYWIGAHVQYTKWIRFNGCYNTDIRQVTKEVGNYSITECYKFCDGTSFGLTMDKCVCLDTPGSIINQVSNDCKATSCPINVDEFCGGASKWWFAQNCVCWYDILDLISDNKIGNCKSMIDKQLTTTNCRDKLDFLCKRRKHNRFYQEKMNWTDAVFACHGEFFDGRFRKRRRSRRYWVGLFRKQSFIWGSRTPPEEFDCLAASVSKDGKLNTFVRKCYSRLPLLCSKPEPKIRTNLSTSVFTSTETVQTTGGLSIISLSVGVISGVIVTMLAVVVFMIVYRCRKNRHDTQTSSDRQEVDSSDIGAVHYEHIRPENRASQVYDVCGHTSVSYDYIHTQEGSDLYPE